MFRTIALASLLLLTASAVQSQSLWDKTKSAVGSTVEVVGSGVKSVGSAVSGDKEDPAVVRSKIDDSASRAIRMLASQDAIAADRLEHSVAYAVFDTRKVSLLLTTGFGSGVAVDKTSGNRVYMNMASGGVNIGYGLQEFQVVFLFPDEASYRDFVDNGWTADAEATAAANQDTGDAALRLKNGVSVYKLNEKGLALSASLSGTKYWKDDELNQ